MLIGESIAPPPAPARPLCRPPVNRRPFRLNAPRLRCVAIDPKPTEYETEVLYLLSEGEGLGDIAAKFGNSRHAVAQQLYRLRQVLCCDTNISLIARALRRGWIT